MILIHNAHIVNEERVFHGSVLIEGDSIADVFEGGVPQNLLDVAEVIEADDAILMPGVIDTHVHFRDPGFPEKADFSTESEAAVAGGVTSVLDMPNTKPQTTSVELWEEKMQMAEAKSYCNYGFYIGATNTNLEELKGADYTKICGVKLFLGSSTGGMLVNRGELIESIFREVPALITVHAEDEAVISRNLEHFKKLYGAEIPIECHPQVRSAEACVKATEYAISMAKRTGARLHVAHLSTEEELGLLENLPASEKRITAETCPHYLYFTDLDYKRLGARIKCNPAIKSVSDRNGLLDALPTNKIDTIATDHAPHRLADKEGTLLKAASGMPSVQYSLPAMAELVQKGYLSLERMVRMMCHNPAIIYGIEKRGFIRKGYKADLTLLRREKSVVRAQNVLSRCGWSPYEGIEFSNEVAATIINGCVAYRDGAFHGRYAEPLTFKVR